MFTYLTWSKFFLWTVKGIIAIKKWEEDYACTRNMQALFWSLKNW